MNLFLEQPVVWAVVGIACGVLIGIGWMKTGRKEWLFALGTVALLTIAGLIVENAVETDREAVERTLAEIARDVESNDLRAVLRHIAATAPAETKPRAEAEMPNYEFTECRVTEVYKLEIDSRAEPRTAVVEFNVRASGKFSQGGLELSDTIFRWVSLDLVREKDGQWRVENYKHDAPKFAPTFGAP